MTHTEVQKALQKIAHPEDVPAFERFFKTAPPGYGAGDKFIGISVPEQRKVARQFKDLPLDEVTKLLQSEVHEYRLTALIIAVERSKKARDFQVRKEFADWYLANSKWVNNWDLVDASAEYLLGPAVDPSDLAVLVRLAGSEDLWERRIAMISTFHHIKGGDPEPTFRTAELLWQDKHDLIHKAVGWMLREADKRCSSADLRSWLRLDGRYLRLPRTMLRYAIERFPEDERQAYLKGTV